jgi:hypothetical protein
VEPRTDADVMPHSTNTDGGFLSGLTEADGSESR